MKTLLITGVNGLLGQHLAARAAGRYRLIGADLGDAWAGPSPSVQYQRADLSDPHAMRGLMAAHRPDVVIHTAAITAVDRCEAEPDLARRVNVEGARHVAQACRDAGARLVHLSTDYVFDGREGPYTEADEPHPLSVYGQTKWEAEQIVGELVPDAVIARTMVLFGHGAGVRPNFVTWLVQSLRNGQPVRIVNDQWGSPTWAGDLAGMLLALLDADASGVFHTAGPEWLHRHAFALKIARVFGLDASLIQAIDSASLGQAAARPLRSGLCIDKVVAQTGYTPRALDTALETLKSEMNGHEA